MVSKCVIGFCLVALCAVPVLAEEGAPKNNVMMSMYVDQATSLRKPPEGAQKVKVKEVMDYYDIDGSSAADLRSQMKHHGTKWHDGKVYAALTTWDIRYHYDIAEQNGSYRVKDIETSVDIAIQMPRLSAGAQISEQLVGSWNTYQNNLKTHELGHRDIAVRIGEELYQELAALESCSSKKELEHRAQALVKTKFHQLKVEQVAYDDQTHHGKKQGAVLHDPAVVESAPAAGRSARAETADRS